MVVVLITRHLTGNWGVTLAFSEIAAVLAYLGGILSYQAVMRVGLAIAAGVAGD